MATKAQKRRRARLRHVRKRALNRWGILLHQDAQAAIARKIEEGDAQFVRETDNAKRVYLVDYEGQRLPVVYDRQRKQLVTVLPPADQLGTPLDEAMMEEQ